MSFSTIQCDSYNSQIKAPKKVSKRKPKKVRAQKSLSDDDFINKHCYVGKPPTLPSSPLYIWGRPLEKSARPLAYYSSFSSTVPTYDFRSASSLHDRTRFEEMKTFQQQFQQLLREGLYLQF